MTTLTPATLEIIKEVNGLIDCAQAAYNCHNYDLIHTFASSFMIRVAFLGSLAGWEFSHMNEIFGPIMKAQANNSYLDIVFYMKVMAKSFDDKFGANSEFEPSAETTWRIYGL